MKPLKALLCDLHVLAVASTLTLVGSLAISLRATSSPPHQGVELLACFSMAWEQPPPLDPRSYERRLAKTHGQFGGGAPLFGHGRFARRGRCSDWDDVARSRLLLAQDSTADAPRAMGLCHGIERTYWRLVRVWAPPTARLLCRNDRACSFRFGTPLADAHVPRTHQGTMMDNAPTHVASTRSGRRMPE